MVVRVLFLKEPGNCYLPRYLLSRGVLDGFITVLRMARQEEQGDASLDPKSWSWKAVLTPESWNLPTYLLR